MKKHKLRILKLNLIWLLKKKIIKMWKRSKWASDFLRVYGSVEEKERRRSCKQPEKEDSDEFVNVWPTDPNSPQRSLHISTKLDDPLNLQRTFYLPDTHLQVKSIHASFLITATIPKDFPTPTSWEQWMRAATSSTARLCERETSHWHPDPAHEWACTKAFVCCDWRTRGKSLDKFWLICLQRLTSAGEH